MPGPPPKPTAMKILDGNPGHRPLNKSEPKPKEVIFMDPPDRLDDFGKYVWKKILPSLVECKLMTEIDLPLFERYCEFWSRWKVCRDFLHSKTLDFYPVFDGECKDKDGNRIVKHIREYPQVNRQFRINTELLKIESHLGMTPAARSRIQLEDLGSLHPDTLTSGKSEEDEDPFKPTLN